MAQVVDVRLVDDIDGSSPADETLTLSLDGDTVEIDLSAEHARNLREALAPFFEAGRRVKQRRLKKPKWTCSECGHVAPNRLALGAHSRQQHGMSVAELHGEPLPFECPECGRKFPKAQGMGAHRRAAHGVTGTSKTATSARAEAKPKRVVEVRHGPPSRASAARKWARAQGMDVPVAGPLPRRIREAYEMSGAGR